MTLRDPQKLVGNICPSQEQSAQVNIFVIVFPVAPKMVQVWVEEALEQEVRTE